MRHVRADDGVALAGVGTGEIHAVPEPVGTERPVGFESLQIAEGARRVDHGRERGGVRRDHELPAQSALEREVRHAERAVLVGLVSVAHVVRALAHAPRHSPLGAVGLLPGERPVVGLGQDGEREGAHHEHRHQVLEHAAAPRHQRRLPRGVGQRPPQPEPVLGGDVVLGDGDEAREPAPRTRADRSTTRPSRAWPAGSRWRTASARRRTGSGNPLPWRSRRPAPRSRGDGPRVRPRRPRWRRARAGWRTAARRARPTRRSAPPPAAGSRRSTRPPVPPIRPGAPRR